MTVYLWIVFEFLHLYWVFSTCELQWSTPSQFENEPPCNVGSNWDEEPTQQLFSDSDNKMWGEASTQQPLFSEINFCFFFFCGVDLSSLCNGEQVRWMDKLLMIFHNLQTYTAKYKYKYTTKYNVVVVILGRGLAIVIVIIIIF